MDTDDAVTTIAQKLGETEPEPLQRLRAVVDILGPEQALALCENALAVEQHFFVAQARASADGGVRGNAILAAVVLGHD